jgi:hypothetical protein
LNYTIYVYNKWHPKKRLSEAGNEVRLEPYPIVPLTNN